MSLAQSNQVVGIIGVGVMGEALLVGLISAGFPVAQITFYEKRDDRAAEVTAKYGVHKASLDELCQKSDVILLVTKPQDLGTLLEGINSSIKKGALLISRSEEHTSELQSH